MSKADNFRVRGYLEHILKAIKRIHYYVENMTETGFLGDIRTQDAVIRNFEVIGEACRNIEHHYPSFAAEHPEVPWGVAYERLGPRVFQGGLGDCLENHSPGFAAIGHANW